LGQLEELPGIPIFQVVMCTASAVSTLANTAQLTCCLQAMPVAAAQHCTYENGGNLRKPLQDVAWLVSGPERGEDRARYNGRAWQIDAVALRFAASKAPVSVWDYLMVDVVLSGAVCCSWQRLVVAVVVNQVAVTTQVCWLNLKAQGFEPSYQWRAVLSGRVYQRCWRCCQLLMRCLMPLLLLLLYLLLQQLLLQNSDAGYSSFTTISSIFCSSCCNFGVWHTLMHQQVILS
jgi:hypothetical protein